MTRYNVYDKAGLLVGYTDNGAECQGYLAAHPGSRAEQTMITGSEFKPGSTLPQITETMPKPKGELLQQ